MSKTMWVKYVTMGKYILVKQANDYVVVQLQVETIPKNFKGRKSVQPFQRYEFWKSGPAAHLPANPEWYNNISAVGRAKA